MNRDLRCALCPKQHSVYDLVVLPSMILVGLVLITIMSLALTVVALVESVQLIRFTTLKWFVEEATSWLNSSWR